MRVGEELGLGGWMIIHKESYPVVLSPVIADAHEYQSEHIECR
jgi:hypothetical protein